MGVPIGAAEGATVGIRVGALVVEGLAVEGETVGRELSTVGTMVGLAVGIRVGPLGACVEGLKVVGARVGRLVVALAINAVTLTSDTG